MQGFSECVEWNQRQKSGVMKDVVCLGGAYYVIAFRQIDGRLLTGAMLICATLCAGLGVLNGAGIDPLGFYQGIKKGQETIFFSTIGNFDFFGTFGDAVWRFFGYSALYKTGKLADACLGLYDHIGSWHDCIQNGLCFCRNVSCLFNAFGALWRRIYAYVACCTAVVCLFCFDSGRTRHFESQSVST